MKINERVEIRKGYNSVGGMYIHEEFIEGKVVKVNKNSIRVHMSHVKYITNGKIMREENMNEEARFTFWKTIENDAGTVSLYKNTKYGIIKVVH